jgi:hypothetical protein
MTLEEVNKLLTKLVEKKSGKKVTGANFPADIRGMEVVFTLEEEKEETNLDEQPSVPKNSN